MNDMLNNRIKIEVIASGKSLEAHVLAVTRLSNEEVAKSINEVIEENESLMKISFLQEAKIRINHQMKQEI